MRNIDSYMIALTSDTMRCSGANSGHNCMFNGLDDVDMQRCMPLVKLHRYDHNNLSDLRLDNSHHEQRRYAYVHLNQG